MSTFETATGKMSFKILPKEMRTRFNGSLAYHAVDATEKWVYKKLQVTHSHSMLFDTPDDYLMAPTTSVATGDLYKFLVIKHTGYEDTNENTASPYGIILSIDSGTPAFDDSNILFIPPGEMIALRLPTRSVAGVLTKTCSIVNGVPSADGISGQNALIEIAAILDDVG